MFEYKSAADIEAMSEYQREKYFESKRKHEADEAAKVAKKEAGVAVKEALEEAKKESDKEVETLRQEIKVVKDEADKYKGEIDEWRTEVNRFKAVAKEEEAKGVKFDTALNKAMDDNVDQLKALASGDTKEVRMQLKAVGDMGLSNISGLASANTQVGPGIYGLPNRRLHMRDIMNTGRMTTSSFTYLKEVGGEGDVNNWTENSGKKPKLDLDYLEAIAPSQFIAGFLKISRKSLDDVSALRASLASRLLQKYLTKEDQQILQGTGVGNQLQGILPVATAYDGDEVENLDRIMDAVGQLEEGDYYVDGILLRPRDYARILRTKGNTLEYTMPGFGVITMENGILHLGGSPVYKMNGMPTAPRQFLAGDWMMGAMLLLREDPIVSFHAEDEDNVQTNQITVRVEGRVALPIFYNGAFVKGEITLPDPQV